MLTSARSWECGCRPFTTTRSHGMLRTWRCIAVQFESTLAFKVYDNGMSPGLGTPAVGGGFLARLKRPATQQVVRFRMGAFRFRCWGFYCRPGSTHHRQRLRSGAMGNGLRSGLGLRFCAWCTLHGLQDIARFLLVCGLGRGCVAVPMLRVPSRGTSTPLRCPACPAH